MASTFDPYAVCVVGSQTNRPETIVASEQNPPYYTLSKGRSICISGTTPLSSANPGQNRKSRTDANNKCDVSLCRVFIRGDAVAHELTVMDDAPDHKMDTGDDEVDPIGFVTYVATGG